ncbi:MarR family winged helix-turn-helix transcriptional regulator [Vreelandella stevensii]|uniref:MarR family winged helix-turn-helix transcriptional regulator n=1 Tax=Vreelandella stevensii TaxID=502821 RepID=UPI000A0365B2|nr:MarR family transcriptional regulator [Halomonas stevensii]
MLRPKHAAMLEQLETQSPESLRGVQLCFELLSAAAAIDDDCGKRLGTFGLSEGRLIVLLLLRKRSEGVIPSELAQLAGVTRGTITGLLDGLESNGLTHRTHDNDDRRRIFVRSTEKGNKLVEKVFVEHASWISNLLSGLTEEEQSEFERLLQKIWKNTDSARGDDIGLK